MDFLLHPEVHYYDENGETHKLELQYKINIDDSIKTIKQKIIYSMSSKLNLVNDDIYLFIKTIFKEITNNSTIELNDIMIKQLMINFNYDDKYIDKVLEKSNYSIEELIEILDFKNNQQLLTAQPLGKNKSTHITQIDIPILFPVNPYLFVDYLIQPLESYDNNIYLNYKFVNKNIIYLCVPEYIIKFYGKKIPNSPVKFFQYYFPNLFKNNITNIYEYNKYKLNIIQSEQSINTLKYWDTINKYYEHYKSINSIDDYPSCKINNNKNDCFRLNLNQFIV
jgi:hypothetical protein